MARVNVFGAYLRSFIFGGVAVGCLFMTPQAFAAKITRTIVDDAGVITITGRAEAGDAKAFAAIVAATPPDPKTIVELSGPGGMVSDGLRIGLIIHQLGWTTRVGDGHACFSTCAFIWLAGKRRVMASDAHIAFHAPFDTRTYKVTDVGRHMMSIYSKALNLNPATVEFIMAKTPGEGFDWIDADKAKTLDFDMEIVKSAKKAVGHFSTAAVDEVEGANALVRKGGEDALIADVKTCYASYRREKRDDKGFSCFALESTSVALAQKRAKDEHRRVDRRFTMNAAVQRLVAAIFAAGHSRRDARRLLVRWQADLKATAVR